MSNPTTPRGTSLPGKPADGKRIRIVFDHLAAMTDERGLFEHARYARPRPEHGYCLDDAARALVVTCREPGPNAVVTRLRDRYLEFVLSALAVSGRCHNRMTTAGRWSDEPDVGDWWGRAVWALGVAAATPEHLGIRARALAGFRVAAQQRSTFGRSMAFAALGAGEVLRSRPGEPAAVALMLDAVAAHASSQARAVTGRMGGSVTQRDWSWPEPRLRYANATVAEALMVAGDLLPDKAVLERGVRLLKFLMRVETHAGHLSVTPVQGRGPGESGPSFDQQPIEVAAIADACATAYRITTDPQWLSGINRAWRWFEGDNDSGVCMYDGLTGAGFDGLQSDGPNLNQGAESTLAALSTAQQAQRVRELR